MINYHLHQHAIDVGCKFEQPAELDGGYDVYSSVNVDIPHRLSDLPNSIWVPTGLHIEIPEGHIGIVKDRSSVAGDGLYTHAGVLDEGFIGEVKIRIENTRTTKAFIKAGDKLTQIIFIRYLSMPTQLVELDQLKQTERGEKGFGSTGK